MATCGILAEIERVDLDEMNRQYPEAFNRKFHAAAGPTWASFLYGSKEGGVVS